MSNVKIRGLSDGQVSGPLQDSDAFEISRSPDSTDTYGVVSQVGDYTATTRNYVSLDTVDKTIVGAINEVFAGTPTAVEDAFTPTLGQTIFTLSSSPSGDAAFSLYLNGQLRLRGVDYTQVGTTLTWLNPSGITLITTDKLIARYNDTGASVIGKTIIAFGANSVSSTTTTRYLYPYVSTSIASTDRQQIIVPYAGTIRNMYVIHNTPDGNGNNIVYTLEKNGISTGIAVSIASTGSTGSNLVNTVSVSAGDKISLKVTKALIIAVSPSDINVTLEIS